MRDEFAAVRAEHRRIVQMLEAGETVEGERKLSGAWRHYSYVQFAEDWLLIYRVEETQVLLVHVGRLAAIFT